MEPRFQFEQLNSGDRTESSFSTVSWSIVADRFFDFLRGCGFELTRQDLSDHFDQSVFDKSASSTDEDPPVENHAERYGLQPEDK